MKVVGGDFFLDGGTVYVDIQVAGVVTRFQLDYSLPWDGRPRYISETANGGTRKVAIGSEEEKQICFVVRNCLELAYGTDAVLNALETSQARKLAWEDYCARQGSLFISLAGYHDPYPLPFDGIWLAAFDFLEKAYLEGKC